jgi:hypothetical protein
MLDDKQLTQLRAPFPPDAIQWKPGATNRDKTKALALAYVDSRHYQSRLDEVAGASWSDHYEVHANGSIIVCSLTIDGTTRCDVGEKDAKDQNTVTSAKAQAFKRACAAFGLGRYLYDFPQEWVPYNERYRRIDDGGLGQLRAIATRHYKQLTGNTPDPTPATRPEPDNGSEPTDATNDAIEKLFSAVTAKTDYYNHLNHMKNAIVKEHDSGWDWPHPDDKSAWNRLYKVALDHARKREQEAQKPAPLFPE